MATQGGRRWSVAFGVWCGVPVRLHLLMLVFAAIAAGATLDGNASAGLIATGVLVASVVVHEVSHCLAAWQVGGRVEGIVLWPVGGLQAPKTPDAPAPQALVALAGPLANLAVALAAAACVLAAGAAPTREVLALFNPIAPRGVLEGAPLAAAGKAAVWINWLLVLLNLMPAYPFDGGPALRAALWPLMGKRTAAVTTAYAAQGLAAMLCVLAVVVEKSNPPGALPTWAPPLWAPLVTLAVFLFFSAQRDLVSPRLVAAAGAPTRRRQPARAAAAESVWLDEANDLVLFETPGDTLSDRRREADDKYEDARVDDILARLHATGFDNLSAEDRAVLQRASRRYRSRQQDGANTPR